MDDLFQDKLSLLQLYYPTVSPEILKDFLTNCEGDIDNTRSLIDGKPRPKKRPASAQAALSIFTEKRPKIKEENIPKLGNSLSTSKSDDRNTSGSTEAKSKRIMSKIITLNTPSDVREHLYPYASLHLNFLPESMSEKIQDDFLDMKDKFGKNKFYLFGNLCESNHSTGIFSRPAAAFSKLVYNGLKRPKPFQYSDSLESVARYTECFINEKIIPNSEKLSFQSNEPWTNDFCVVNCYEKLQNNMDWHSDRLSHIGPHNYVASISLGTTRMFRLRSTYKEHGPIYEVPLPHNSLFLMRPGCQEEFKHSLSTMSKAVDVHPRLGTMRFGITARCYPTFFIENSPKCKCGTGMLLRRSYKSVSTRGRYFWSCENTYQNKGCNSFYWCDFQNVEGHYIAKDGQSVSTWIAPEDKEKLEYDNSF
ncbi:hypothetical protein JCM33374_g5714 [Metschnikowia sp. JCM 33374]|nr:hypothetical protein JCM33374_g5714 [Metschnikowia sp. JCM 33374]